MSDVANSYHTVLSVNYISILTDNLDTFTWNKIHRYKETEGNGQRVINTRWNQISLYVKNRTENE